MGLLDRLAGNLIADSMGLPPGLTRGLVRRAMGNEVVLMGGAALAGALLSEMMSGQQQQPGATGAQGPWTGQPAWGTPPPPPPGAAPGSAWTPPPLPPLPPAGGSAPDWVPPPPPAPGATAAASTTGWTPPPPPPPLEPAATAEPELPPQLLYAVVRTMVAAALADGVLAPEERARIQEHLGSGELPEEQAAQVHRDLLLPATPEELAAMATSDAERALLYRFAALVTRADARLEASEEMWLGRLAAALGIDPERRQALERELFGGG